jgi:hypothetical protein
MPAFKTAIGFVLVFTGSQIPWFFVGSAGFLLGDFVGTTNQLIEKTWDLFINDLKYGVLTSLVSFLHKRSTVIIGGGLHCAFLVYNLPNFLGWKMDWFSWQYYVIAAIVGILFVYFINTLAIMTISTFSGALLVAQNSTLGTISPWVMLIMMIFLGITTQFILLRYYQPPQDESTS